MQVITKLLSHCLSPGFDISQSHSSWLTALGGRRGTSPTQGGLVTVNFNFPLLCVSQCSAENIWKAFRPHDEPKVSSLSESGRKRKSTSTESSLDGISSGSAVGGNQKVFLEIQYCSSPSQPRVPLRPDGHSSQYTKQASVWAVAGRESSFTRVNAEKQKLESKWGCCRFEQSHVVNRRFCQPLKVSRRVYVSCWAQYNPFQTMGAIDGWGNITWAPSRL